MAVQPRVTYPGVYIQEVPSDVHTITPVSTSTTAFIGIAKRGPVNEPIICNSFADFQTVFGGLWLDSALGYAVSDFFLNGGTTAVVVRLFHVAPPAATAPQAVSAGATPAAASSGSAAAASGSAAASGGAAAGGATPPAASTSAAAPATPPATSGTTATPAATPAPPATTTPAADGAATLTVGGLTFKAKNPGAWGNGLQGRVTYPDPKVAPMLANQYGVTANDLFTLEIQDALTGNTEVFPNVTVTPGPREVDKVVASGSDLVAYTGTLPTARPAAAAIDPATKQAAYTPSDKNGADSPDLDPTDVLGDQAAKTGIFALEHADIFNLMCIPPYNKAGDDVDPSILTQAAAYCQQRRAMLIIDPPRDATKKTMVDSVPLPIMPGENALIVFPRILEANPLRDNHVETFVPCGAVAGVMARTDSTRGVWKAAAGLEATLRGVVKPSIPMTDAENGELNPLGINCLRSMVPAGNLVWGARTLVGDDRLASQWKYVPVRRTALFIEESLYRGMTWAVFEPNDEPLWAQIRLNVGVFMHDLFRQGAFQGQSPKDAYLVQCDASTTTQSDIDKGIVNVVVGFAPLKPAEFVIIYIKQLAGQLQV